MVEGSNNDKPILAKMTPSVHGKLKLILKRYLSEHDTHSLKFLRQYAEGKLHLDLSKVKKQLKEIAQTLIEKVDEQRTARMEGLDFID